MQAIVLREALVAARKPALIAVAIACAGVLALFPTVWGVRGLPIADGSSLYDQQFRLEWILLLFALPWATARAMADDCGDDLVRLSALIAVAPSRVLLARLMAAGAAAMLVILAALPAVATAQQISAVPLSRMILDQAAMLSFALPVATVSVWWMHRTADRLLGWLGSAATTLLSTIAVRLLVGTMAEAVVVLAAVAVAAAAVLLKRAGASWLYLSESVA
jgi:hypothetical protein